MVGVVKLSLYLPKQKQSMLFCCRRSVWINRKVSEKPLWKINVPHMLLMAVWLQKKQNNKETPVYCEKLLSRTFCFSLSISLAFPVLHLFPLHYFSLVLLLKHMHHTLVFQERNKFYYLRKGGSQMLCCTTSSWTDTVNLGYRKQVCSVCFAWVSLSSSPSWSCNFNLRGMLDYL